MTLTDEAVKLKNDCVSREEWIWSWCNDHGEDTNCRKEHVATEGGMFIYDLLKGHENLQNWSQPRLMF